MNKFVVNSKKLVLSVFLICMLALGSLILAGCAQNNDSNSTDATSGVEAQVEIGEKTKDCYKLQVINDTNVPVRQLTVKDNNSGETHELAIKSDDSIWKTSDIANIYIPKSTGENQNTDAQLKDTYDFNLVIDDSIQLVMHAISPENLQSVNDLRLRYSEVDNMCFFEYMDETGPVNTLEAEKAVIEQEKVEREKQEREAEEQAKAQEAEASASDNSASSSNANAYVAPSAGNSTATDSAAPSSGSGAAQSEDQCAPDAVLNY